MKSITAKANSNLTARITKLRLKQYAIRNTAKVPKGLKRRTVALPTLRKNGNIVITSWLKNLIQQAGYLDRRGIPGKEILLRLLTNRYYYRMVKAVDVGLTPNEGLTKYLLKDFPGIDELNQSDAQNVKMFIGSIIKMTLTEDGVYEQDKRGVKTKDTRLFTSGSTYRYVNKEFNK